ncbi:hypothetical protein [Oceanibaculum nanhaiense]|uniref:hypothetical protein n=1 Tax=Oceanibaculum nanhaiense TaxID=1909734 RepID=UPI003D2D8AEB
MEPTFGGINLEDIKAPECFEVERRLRERMKIPVFHDDQHGTAIIVAAGDVQRAAPGRQEVRRRQAGYVGRRCGRAGLRRSAGRYGAETRERNAHRHRRRGLSKAATS